MKTYKMEHILVSNLDNLCDYEFDSLTLLCIDIDSTDLDSMDTDNNILITLYMIYNEYKKICGY